MKNNIYGLMVFGVIVCMGFLMGCDLDGNSQNSGTPLLNVRSVINDPINGCVNENVHQHNGIHYSGHYNNDGHEHHGLTADNVCFVTNCNETGLHQHNGVHYSGHSGNDNCNHHGNGHH